MKTDLSNFSGWVIYEKGTIVATYDKENFHRYYDQEEIRILQQRIDKAIECIHLFGIYKDTLDEGLDIRKILKNILEILGDKENE